jgi:RNA polymerase sigma-70 factor (ECF subfamily)
MRRSIQSPRLSQDGRTIATSLNRPEAFTDVFDRHFAAVHRYLARRAGPDIADDLAAQTFTLAFAHRGRYRDDLGTARPWLLGIATNLLRAGQRSARREQAIVARLAHDPWLSATAATTVIPEPDGALSSALARLDSNQRDALLLHVWGELGYAEIAACLEIPLGTVRSRISRACAALRRDLEEPAAADVPIADQRSNRA